MAHVIRPSYARFKLAVGNVNRLWVTSPCSASYSHGLAGTQQRRHKIYRNRAAIDIPDNITYTDLILDKCRQQGERVAFVDETSGKSYSYSDFVRHVTKFASSLHKQGMKKGDVYCSYVPNSVELAIAFFGVAAAGGIMSLANPLYTVDEVVRHLEACKATNFHTRAMLKEPVLKALDIYTDIKPENVIYEESDSSSGQSFWQLVEQGDEQMPQIDFDVKKDVCYLPFSSGTTGIPKGTMLTHYNLVAHTISINGEPEHTWHRAGDHCISLFPYFHVGGSTCSLLNFLYNGCTVHIRPRFVFEELLHDMEKYKVRQILLPPTIIRLLAFDPRVDEYDVSSLKEILVGAAPVGPAIEEAVIRRLNLDSVDQGYGMTEFSGLTHTTFGYGIKKRGTVGRLFPSIEMKILDIDTGEILPQGATGEVVMRAPTSMTGYLNNPQATAEFIDEDGWLHTGDIGYVDEEDNTFIVDRKKELIKTKGFQVAPAELEDTILQHPAVQDAAVIGIDDEKRGEVPRAYVVKRQGAQVTEDEIKQFVAEKLARFKHLEGGVQFLDDIPKLQSGKLLRRVLRDEYDAQNAKSN